METFVIGLIILGSVVVIVGIVIALASPVLSALLERRAAAKGRVAPAVAGRPRR
jgi:hypothetical protein